MKVHFPQKVNRYILLFGEVWWGLALLISCTQHRLPISSSKPYEVMVIGDQDSMLTHQLIEDAPGLPQSEPLFDVYNQKQLEGDNKLSRAIVIYDKKVKHLTISTNQYAEPQVVIRTNGKEKEELQKKLTTFEYAVRLDYLKKHHNLEYEKLIKKQFNIDMLIPSDMRSIKKSNEFIWISNNRAEAMQNIIICKGDIDEQLRTNMKGETDSMYMVLHPIEGKNYGLWEMKGDAMGGAYRMLNIKAVKDRKSANIQHSTLSIIAFVYAPGTKKRNLMRQLEAVLYNTNKSNNYGK